MIYAVKLSLFYVYNCLRERFSAQIDIFRRGEIWKKQHCLTLVKDVNITSLYLRHKCPINYEI